MTSPFPDTMNQAWSVAVGGAYRRSQNTFHGTVEAFESVSAFDVLDTSPFASDPSAALYSFTVDRFC